MTTRYHYGAREDNGLDTLGVTGTEYHSQFDLEVDWTDSRLAKVTRLRMLTDAGFPAFDISYCHGELKDGTKVSVRLPFDQLPKKFWKRAIIEYAKRDKVYALRLGLLNPANISVLW